MARIKLTALGWDEDGPEGVGERVTKHTVLIDAYAVQMLIQFKDYTGVYTEIPKRNAIDANSTLRVVETVEEIEKLLEESRPSRVSRRIVRNDHPDYNAVDAGFDPPPTGADRLRARE